MRAAVLLACVVAAATAPGCGPDEATPCGDTHICEPGASCFADDPSCDVPTRCATGFEARYYGRSVARDGGCVAASDDACRKSRLSCGVWGQCFAPPADWVAPGDCGRARTDLDYRASRLPGCTGLGTCVALADDDCAASRGCALNGRCAAQSGVCVAPDDAACAASELCAIAGECALLGDGRCGATELAHCEASENCTDLGNCALRNTGCVACARSQGCAAEGLCAERDAKCQAASQAHCRRSAVCRQQGRCKLSRGRCVK